MQQSTTSNVSTITTYTIDLAHSSFSFTVKHMMISNVMGKFDKFDGQITLDPNDLEHSKANISIDASSINTSVEQRDQHLKSPDFFDALKFASITFVSTKFNKNAITGNLTIKGVTKEVTIPVTLDGPIKDMSGANVIGITGSTTINRQDYGLSWNKAMDHGGVLVSDNVVINISIEANQK